MVRRWVDTGDGLAILRGVSSKTSKPRPMAATNPHTAPTMIRIEPALRDALDRWVERLNAANTGPAWCRTDVIRAALQRAVRERGEDGQTP